MTETTVEKVARAFDTFGVSGGNDWGVIYRRDNENEDPLLEFDNYDDADAACRRMNVQAAIKAHLDCLMEPTEWMILAGEMEANMMPSLRPGEIFKAMLRASHDIEGEGQ